MLFDLSENVLKAILTATAQRKAAAAAAAAAAETVAAEAREAVHRPPRIHPDAALDAHPASRSEGLMASASAFFKAAPSALAVIPVVPAVDRGVVMDEALTVRWEDLVTYTLQFKRQEHRTKEV